MPDEDNEGWHVRVGNTLNALEIIELSADQSALRSLWTVARADDGRRIARIYVAPDLESHEASQVLQKAMGVLDREDIEETRDTPAQQISKFFAKLEVSRPELRVSGVILPDNESSQGVLVQSVSHVWYTLVQQVQADWALAYQIPSAIWEEIVAGAYHKAGFDEVVLTPRSGDHGRDVIAIKRGVGSIKILGSVKAYKPGHLVGYDDVRALLGVMSGERDTSKGIITTTSAFPPKIMSDPFIAPFVPTRLELMDGKALQAWLADLSRKG